MTIEKLASRMVIPALCSLALVLWSGRAEAAQTVHLWLEIDGAEIPGDSTVTSLGREGTIECSSFGENGYTPIDAASGLPTGSRQHRPITILKRVDRSSPFLWKAWSRGEPVTRAIFRFYRPSPSGSGAEEQFLTIALEGGLVTGMSVGSQDTMVGGADALPAMESVTFSFQTITWTYEINGATHSDSWAAPR